MKRDRNVAVPAVPAASTKGSTGRQHVAAARTLPTAETEATSAPFEEDFPAMLIVSVFMDARYPLEARNRRLEWKIESSQLGFDTLRKTPLQQKCDADPDTNDGPNQRDVEVSYA